jgi:hypothetical protein
MQATSSNKGYDWTEPTPTDVPNPDSKTQVRPSGLASPLLRLLELCSSRHDEPHARLQIMRIKPDGPLVMAFNDHRRDALTVHGKEVKVRLPAKCLLVHLGMTAGIIRPLSRTEPSARANRRALRGGARNANLPAY